MTARYPGIAGALRRITHRIEARSYRLAYRLGYGAPCRLVNLTTGKIWLLALLALAALTLPVHAETIRLLALGDSLTAGYNLPQPAAFPVRLEAALRAEGFDVTVINAGVSGDTSAGGLARLDWLLGDDPPDAAIVELGANDGLRGLDPADTETNLDAILTKLEGRGVKVLLAGMLAPPNLGREYTDAFAAVYPTLAQRHDVPLYPFFLDGVTAQPGMVQTDGMHPTEAGVDVMVAGILPQVRDLLATK